MPKLKTKRTLAKRVRVTSTGKLVRERIGTGHLKVKHDTSTMYRKARHTSVNSGFTKKIKAMLGI